MLPQPHPLARSVLGLALLVFGTASGAGPRAAVRKTQTKTPVNACTTCLERRPILDSLLFESASDRDVPRAYEAARRFPDIIDRLHCFCECKENEKERHKTLLTCFTSEHAAGCGICQKEALLAAQLKDRGIADDDIERTVESLFRLDGHPPTFGRGM
jgi:hypothetical protein